MPGIFGFRFKKKSTRDQAKHLVERMADVMMHGEGYGCRTYSGEGMGLGAVGFKDSKVLRIHVDVESGNVICLQGDIFSIVHDGFEQEQTADPLVQERILALYGKIGMKVAESLNGDFNIAIHDARRNRLILFNDRFGFRHLFVYEDEDILMFSPEIKAFLRYSGFSKKIDEQGIADYFNYFYHLGDRTMFKKVKLLPPASCLSLEDKKRKQVCYWEPRYTRERKPEDLDECIETGYQLFRSSLSKRIAGRKRLIVPLSGGLDSRLIIATAKDFNCDIHAATFGEAKCSEVKIARQVCRTLGIKKHIRIQIEPEWIPNYSKKMLWLTEANYATLATTRLCGFHEKIGEKGFDGLLNGIFGGHLSFGPPYFTESDFKNRALAEGQLGQIITGLEGQRYDLFLSSCATKTMNDIVSSYREKSVSEEWERTSAASKIPAFRKDRLFLYNRMRRGMNYLDLNRFFYDSLLPFASYKLFDFYLSLSQDLMLNQYLYKEIFKRKLPKLATIPYQNTGVNLFCEPSRLRIRVSHLKKKLSWYLTRLTNGIIEVKDTGTYMHYDHDYRKNSNTRSWVKGILLNDRFIGRDFFRKEGIERLLAYQDRGGTVFHEIGKLICFELWARQFLD